MVVLNLLMVVLMEDGRSDPKLVVLTGSERLFSILPLPGEKARAVLLVARRSLRVEVNTLAAIKCASV